MRWYVVAGFALTLSAAACAVVGEDSDSSAADFSHGRGRPGNGRPPGQPILADDDAGAPAGQGLSAKADEDAAPPIADEDAGDGGEAPVVEEDAGAAPVEDEDAGA